jgi:hypothetical protein
MVRPAALETIANQAVAPPPLSLDTLTGVVKGLRAVTPMEELTESLGLTEDEIFRIVTDLGTWLIHAHGAAPGVIVFAAQQAQLSMLQGQGLSNDVVIPLGFDRRQGRRHDVTRSIRAIIVHNPDSTELARYIDRQRVHTESAVLSGRDVFVVWAVATLGRLHELHKGSSLKSWATVMLEAYDLLDVSLSDAHRAARQISASSRLNLDELGDALTKLAWLNEPRIGRLTRLLEMCKEDPGHQSMRVLERDVAIFSQELLARPSWLAATIANLDVVQVTRLVARNGLGFNLEIRKIELNVRKALAARGLKRDFDLLVPAGVRAILLGAEDVFWDSLDARASGDPDWRVPLDEALEVGADVIN